MLHELPGRPGVVAGVLKLRQAQLQRQSRPAAGLPPRCEEELAEGAWKEPQQEPRLFAVPSTVRAVEATAA